MWNPPNPRAFNLLVWEIVRQIPEGVVSTYGQIASMIPPPDGSDPEEYKQLGARWVGSAMRAKPDSPIPWHRVINTQGKISLPEGSADAETQRRKLEMEGVQFNKNAKVDLKRIGWTGPDKDWLQARGLFPPKLLG